MIIKKVDACDAGDFNYSSFYQEVVSSHEALKELRNKPRIIPFESSSGLSMFIVDLTQEHTGSFKIRGAAVSISEFIRNQEPIFNHLTAASSGNFGMAVALVASKFNLDATVFMPESSAICKQNYVKKLGGQVVVTNDGEARRSAVEFTKKQPSRFFIDGAQWPAFRGNGTFLIDLLQAGFLTEEKIALVLPLGSGSLAIPMGLVLREIKPSADLIVVEPISYCKFLTKYAKDVKPTWEKTIAEGVALHQLPPLSDQLLPTVANVVCAVEEAEIINAMQYLWKNYRLRAEASAVLPIAAYLANPALFAQYQQTYFFVTGGNIDDELFQICL